jgi:hypothetical protein
MEKFNEVYLFIIAMIIAVICFTFYQSTICKKTEYSYDGGRQYIKSEETYKCECKK